MDFQSAVKHVLHFCCEVQAKCQEWPAYAFASSSVDAVDTRKADQVCSSLHIDEGSGQC